MANEWIQANPVQTYTTYEWSMGGPHVLIDNTAAGDLDVSPDDDLAVTDYDNLNIAHGVYVYDTQ